MAIDEVLWLVNHHDKPIGTIKRKNTKTNTESITRKIGVIIFNNQNRILFQQRSLTKKKNPGGWTISCGGHVTYPDTYVASAHRELREELGFDTKLMLAGSLLIKRNFDKYFLKIFIGKYNNEEITIDSSEVNSHKFHSETEFKKPLTTNDHSYTRGKSKLFAQAFWDGEFDEIKDRF